MGSRLIHKGFFRLPVHRGRYTAQIFLSTVEDPQRLDFSRRPDAVRGRASHRAGGVRDPLPRARIFDQTPVGGCHAVACAPALGTALPRQITAIGCRRAGRRNRAFSPWPTWPLKTPTCPSAPWSRNVTPQSALALNDAVQGKPYGSTAPEQTRSSDTADSLLKRLGAFDPAAAAFLRQDSVVQQTLMGRAGRNVTAEAAADQSLLRLVGALEPGRRRHVQAPHGRQTATGFQSRLETLPLTASARLTGGVIQSSLFAATDEARIPDSIAIQLAEIFPGDIDFTVRLRKG